MKMKWTITTKPTINYITCVEITKKQILILLAHYTYGKGYYEQKKTDEDFSEYGLEDIILTNDTITSTDLIRRKWLENDFTGIIFSLNHKIKN